MTTIKIAEDRLARLPYLVITNGPHQPGGGMCVNEAYAFLAGEPHSDAPACVCPTIRAVTMRFNDRCGTGPEADARRKRLLDATYLVALGSRLTPDVSTRRAWMGADWSWRVALPRLLRRTRSLASWAERLETMPEIMDGTTLSAARKTVYECREAACLERRAWWLPACS